MSARDESRGPKPTPTSAPTATPAAATPTTATLGGASPPSPAPPLLDVVTVHAGTRYPDLYVERLRNMVARHLPMPHRFVVWTDEPAGAPRTFGPGVECRDLSAWRMAGTRNKLRLFDPAVGGERPFLFLDSTLVIRKSLLPLVQRGRATRASLVAVQDWNYPTLNSSVMWVRPDEHTARVWEEWVRTGNENWTIRGDQNWINHVFRSQSPEALTFWATGRVASYKALRKRARHDPTGAMAAARACTILKFHGLPKPTHVLEPRSHLRSTVLRHPLQPRLWRFLEGEIREHWR